LTGLRRRLTPCCRTLDCGSAWDARRRDAPLRSLTSLPAPWSSNASMIAWS